MEPKISALPTTYTASEWENRLYTLWEKSGFFNPDECIKAGITAADAKPFSIIMPPPNANGRLHVGHALFITIEDLLIRFHRMNGKKALWIPGADHAGFETWVVYEKKLEKEGRSRFDLSRQALYQEIYDFTLENKQHMENDVRRMGASCDWSREKFTLDPEVVSEVQKTFRKMFADGLVYRGRRIVNWCPKHQTGLSDVETESKEEAAPLYYFKYGPFDIATVRPETKFGDKYVVMHPEDKRYASYKHGDKLTVEWINGPIEATIIKDPVMDMNFGTGVMTITPWHSVVDYDLALKYNLDIEQIIDENGSLLPIANEFSGLPIAEARERIVEKLKQKGLLVKIDEQYSHVKKVCFKCGTLIEPQAKDQWFVKMKPLAELALKAVRDEKLITFYPENYTKIFTYWMENTIDWNISRQIVWGITIPAQYCPACNQGFIDKKAHDTCSCGGSIVEETDTFDTWFSSGQWPLLTLGYPQDKDLATYFPTTVMETGHDLIFKWIPRMVFFSLYLTGKVPFQNVYLHGLVNDEHGKKMSKSKGNVISPIDLSDKYGTDAMRIALVIGNAPGNNLPLSYQKVEAARNFANKLWNIGRYVALSFDSKNTIPETKNPSDQWVLSRLSEVTSDVTTHLEHYNISLASETLRDFTWNEFADWYVEIHKVQKNDAVLRFVFETLLKLWHPFMPFVTEALFQTFTPDEKMPLMVAKWPEKNELAKNNSHAERFKLVIKLIQEIRAIRSIYKIEPAKKIAIMIIAGASERTLVRDNGAVFKHLARISEIHIIHTVADVPKNSILVQAGLLQAYIELGGVIDFEKEQERLTKEKNDKERYVATIESKLDNQNFIAHAKPEIIAAEKDKLAEAQKHLADIIQHITSLS